MLHTSPAVSVTKTLLFSNLQHIYLLGGPSVYNDMKCNFPGAFPSISTIQKKLSTEYSLRRREGEINAENLKQYFLAKGYSLQIAVAEDATAIISKREYDSKSNCIYGSSLPLTSTGIL